MRLLLIHTAGAEGSVALADTAAVTPIVSTERLPGRSSSEQLVPCICRLMKAESWETSSLTAIVVVHGPGSFTGVRVGLSAAKGLSEANGVPLISVSRLALLAGGVEGHRLVHAVLSAGRGEFYLGEYAGELCLHEAMVSLAGVISSVENGVAIVCEPEVASALDLLNPFLIDEPAAGDTLPIALRRLAQGDFDDPVLLDANYLRRTDAEIYAKTLSPRDTR